ncbi:toll/interleukin-1 receptor domain-containing protein [Phytohabitans rumicis]|uniref:TIR domain-containing protein n=1 Tax=Phytohabitans rumicis TaxID=1076125 RepID=A0A6V8LHH7_9ACTN|nr:TIR domain-containing protein [Phytohabitans rumicis]GFJ93547.1 hypothetical protein Prum_071890 [Phytohabitans rumicis]
MRQALRWVLAVMIGGSGLAVAWWLGEAVFRLDRGTAVTIAAVVGPMVGTPFAWWASRDIVPVSDVAAPVTTSGGGHVFLCYSHRRDQAYAQRLASFLTRAGVPVWLDQEIITGHRWDQVIREKIDTCAAVVVVMTPAAEESRWVMREITYAEKADRPILPLLLSGREFFGLSDLQYEDVTGGRMPGPTFMARLPNMVTSGAPKPTPADDQKSVPSPSQPVAADAVPGTAPAASAARLGVNSPIQLRSTAVPPVEQIGPDTERSRRWSRRTITGVVVAVTMVSGGLTALASDVPTHGRNGATSPAGQGSGTPAPSASQVSVSASAATPSLTPVLASVDRFQPTRAARVATLINFDYGVAFSSRAQILASAAYGSTEVKLWDVSNPATPTPRATLSDSGGRVVFSPDGRVLATTTGDQKRVKLWNVSEPAHAAVAATLTGYTGRIGEMAFSPDGHTLAAAGAAKTVKLWNISDPTHAAVVATLTGHTDSVEGVAFSPNRSMLATTGSDRTIKLWNIGDPARPALLATLAARNVPGRQGFTQAVAFGTDGRLLATTGYKVTTLWNVSDPTRATVVATLKGHIHSVDGVAFSPNGRTVATASYDRTVRLWNVSVPTRPTMVATLTGHSDYVDKVAFSPSGRLVAAAAGDGTIIVWRLS